MIAGKGTDGRDGRDPRSMTFKGRYLASKSYNAMDIVAVDRQAWLCVRDDAKGVPGVDDDCWVLLGARGPQGRTGKVGPMGPRGPHGEAAPRLHHWEADASPRYRLLAQMADGTVMTVETRPLFQQFLEEMS
jgi:hypothetical protein